MDAEREENQLLNLPGLKDTPGHLLSAVAAVIIWGGNMKENILFMV